MTLTGKTLSETYKSLLRVDDNTNGVNTIPERVTDGEGTSSALKLSDDQVHVNPVNDETTTAFSVKSQSGTQLFVVDSTNSLVKANGHSVTTQYASFHMNSTWFSTAADDTHTALAFNAQNLAAILGFGTGTDPATSFTTAEGTGTRAGELVPCLWYVPDNIKILGVTSLEGADAATGDTTRMHLMSYTFTSGSTSCLADGVVIAANSDVTNAGSEQAYKSTWTVDTSNDTVSSGKVIMAFLKSDSINSDYSASIFIKYILV